MKTERPKFKTPLEPLDIAIELASIVLLILMWTYLILEYGSLPETIASHFNGSGEPDGYSKKLFLWILPSMATAMYVGLLVLCKYPHLHNYTVNITEANAPALYKFSVRVLRVVNFLCVLMFAYINYKIIEGAKNNVSDLGLGFVMTVVGISIILPIVIFIYQKKLKA